MRPLNPQLYEALRAAFGRVRLAHDGAQMLATYHARPDGRLRMQVLSPGEYYRVNCFACSDQRFRLWINHRWGVRDPRTGSRNRYLAICFNEDCLANEANRVELIRRTSWYNRYATAGQVAVHRGYVEEAGKPIALPADFVLLDQLEGRHLARRYVRKRGFDPEQLARVWQVGFSKVAFSLSRQGRLLIPIFKLDQGKFKCWGWQTRALVEGDGYKYFTAPGLRKSCLLYGLEQVSKGDGPVLICEGATDVWRAGKDAVALIGKHASAEQVRLLRKHLHGRPLVVALDADASEQAEVLARTLRSARQQSLLHPDSAPVVQLQLPAGCDPADCKRQELWGLARNALARARRKAAAEGG